MPTKKAKSEESSEAIVIKIVQSVRPGDVLIFECDQAQTTKQLQHLHEQLKKKLPDNRIVILNKGFHLAPGQTIATLKAE